MSSAFTTQLTFDWAGQSSVPTPVVTPSNKKSSDSVNAKPAPQKLVRKHSASGSEVHLGIPATAKPMDEILAEHRTSQGTNLRRNRTDHISDLLLVVLDRYGITPDEFLSTLQDS